MSGRVLLIVLLVGLLFSVEVVYAYESSEEAMFVLEEVMDRLNRFHIDKPGLDELVDGAVEGMIQRVGDPYTEYFTAGELEEFVNLLDGNFLGIGVELQPGDYYPSVVRVLPFSPAEKAGIKGGDVVITVDNVDLTGLDLSEVVEIIRGTQGSRVKITVDRPGEGILDFEIVREKINIPTVDYSLVKGQTGYVYVGSFGSETAKEFEHALKELKAKGIHALILDVRNNGGGYLQAAVEMASQFLPSGSLVVSMVDNEGNRDNLVTSGSPGVQGIPVAVIVNENSASAAEVLAAALGDHGVARLVGTRTYGKGVMQTVIPLVDGGTIKMTTHRYYTPAGKTLDTVGLIPYREVILPELQLVAAWQELNCPDYRLEFEMDKDMVKVNGIEVDYPYMPFWDANHLFMPLRFTLEALGYRVQFSGEEIKITGYGDTLELYPGSEKGRLNNVEKEFERPVMMRNGISYVPVYTLKVLGPGISLDTGSVCVCLQRLEHTE